MPTKFFTPAIFLSAFVLLCQTVQAAPIRTSQMIGFSTGNLGTVGASENWLGGSANVTVTSGSGSLNGSPLGLFASAGDKADISGTAATNTYLSFATSGQYPQSAPTNLYYSFLYRFKAVTNISSLTKLIQVNVQNSGTTVYWNLEARTNSSGQIQLGIKKTDPGTAVYATNNINEGETIFVVVRQQILIGGANDVMDLWINPPANSFGTESIPAPNVTTASGTEPTSATGPGRFYVLSGANANIDEVRISVNSWGDVTPPGNACVAAQFTVQPLSQTNSEGVSANFSVASDSSSPTFRWQVSTDGGTVWNDANTGTGFNTPAFTTPILTVSDNGKKYRSIVNVLCGGGSSATSEVATVTVTAAVSTPQGLIVDDTWTDLSRNNLPFTTNNSVWYASAAASLDASSGTMVGIPASLTSRLWVGYFVDLDTNLPVHLDVGKALKITLAFRPDSFTSMTGNSGLRFGLFDYSDGGTRLSADFSSGSAGNGVNVRGYMLDQDFGTNFSANLPMAISARNGLSDNNLMGSSGNFVTLTNGPAGATLSGAPAFAAGTNYTLEFTVDRTGVNSTVITTKISGGGSNWVTTATDNRFAYPRFDAFAIRAASLETSADSFSFTQFKAEVIAGTPLAIPLSIERSGNNVILSWSNPVFQLQASTQVTGTYTNVPAASSPYTNAIGGSQLFFRLNTN